MSNIADEEGPGLIVWRTKPNISHCMSNFITLVTVAQRRLCIVTIPIVLPVLFFTYSSGIDVVVVLVVHLVVIAALILVVVLLLVWFWRLFLVWF